jgi:DNA-binding NarL/FixJ family response regulator
LLAGADGIEIVGEAGDGDEALTLFRQRRPDVLVLDIWMPGKNGIEVLETVRREDQSIVVVMLTNDVFHQHRRRCFELGADYFLHKSRDFESLAWVLLERQRGEQPEWGWSVESSSLCALRLWGDVEAQRQSATPEECLLRGRAGAHNCSEES